MNYTVDSAGNVQYKCCGVYGPNDYNQSEWKKSINGFVSKCNVFVCDNRYIHKYIPSLH